MKTILTTKLLNNEWIKFENLKERTSKYLKSFVFFESGDKGTIAPNQTFVVSNSSPELFKYTIMSSKKHSFHQRDCHKPHGLIQKREFRYGIRGLLRATQIGITEDYYRHTGSIAGVYQKPCYHGSRQLWRFHKQICPGYRWLSFYLLLIIHCRYSTRHMRAFGKWGSLWGEFSSLLISAFSRNSFFCNHRAFCNYFLPLYSRNSWTVFYAF